MTFKYAHSNKAGNHGDVLKHTMWQLLLTETLACHENEGVVVVDIHAGNGLYKIASDDGNTYSKGASSGIARVLEKQAEHQENIPLPVRRYLELLRRHNEEYDQDEDCARTKFYPGSPVITQMRFRPKDEHVLFELSESHFLDLQRLLKDSKATTIYNDNGLVKVTEVIRENADKPHLCLIDPPYENEHECTEVLESVQRILDSCAGFTIMIWIPLFQDSHPEIAALQKNLASITKSFDTISASVRVARKGMVGSCVFIVNPTPRLHALLESSETLSWMAATLEQEPGCGDYELVH
jgi:23S rRNA (adenine2030-N6)-methyltransferase